MADITGWVAAAIALTVFLPQLVTLRTNRGPAEGVSAAAWAFIVINEWAWLVWGVYQQDWPLAVASFVPLTVSGTVAFIVARRGRQWRPFTLSIVTAIVITPVAALVAVLAVVCQAAPALLQWRRSRVSTNGISAGTWCIQVALSGAWLVHGIAAHDFVVILPELVIIPAAFAVAYRCRRSAKRPGLICATAAQAVV